MRLVSLLAFVVLALTAISATAEDKKEVPNQASNNNIDISATVLLDPKLIHDDVGADLPMGYVAVRVRVTPKTDHAIRVSPDDFTLVSRKDGQRSGSLDANQIAGTGGFILRTGPKGGLEATKSSSDAATAQANPLIVALDAKALHDMETKDPVEGVVYFLMEEKLKPKDLGLLYKGAAGRLALDFK